MPLLYTLYIFGFGCRLTVSKSIKNTCELWFWKAVINSGALVSFHTFGCGRLDFAYFFLLPAGHRTAVRCAVWSCFEWFLFCFCSPSNIFAKIVDIEGCRATGYELWYGWAFSDLSAFFFLSFLFALLTGKRWMCLGQISVQTNL